MGSQIQQTHRKGKLVHIILLVLPIGYIMASNSYFKDQVILAGSFTYIPVTIMLVSTSIYFLLEFRKKTNMLALTSLVASTVSWFTAEMVWMIEEMILKIDPFPSLADVFYILGYPFLLVFLYSVSKTTKTTNPVRIISAAVGLAFLIPTMAAALTTYGDNPLDFALTATYTVFDALLIWIILNNVLSVNNRQNSFWILMFIGLGLLLIGDSFFIVLETSGEYYTGHPIEVFFLCSYVTISYGLYYQVNTARKRKWEGPTELFSPDKPTTTNFLQNLILVSSSAVVIIAVSLITVLGFEEFTTNQAATFSMIMIASVIVVSALCTLTYVLGKKLGNLKQLQKRYEETSALVEIRPSYSVPSLVARIERLEKSNKSMGMVTLFGVLATVIMSASFVSENLFGPDLEPRVLQSGRYLMENLDGMQVATDVFWKIKPGEPLRVHIVNSDLVSEDKIDTIKEAILSEETVEIPNSELGKEPADLVATYYVGWRGALQEASQEQTAFSVPTDFQISESDKTLGDVSIILSNQQQNDRSTSSTKLIVDENENQLLKAHITIFDVKNLRNYDFEDIVRHEFAHAMGLKHQNQVNINLHEGHAYISQCNVDNIVKLYNEDFSHSTCN